MVHRDDYDEFMAYLYIKYELHISDLTNIRRKNFKQYYEDDGFGNKNDYLYLFVECENDYFKILYTFVHSNWKRDWIVDWTYMGEFNSRKKKLDKLNKL